MKYKNKISAPIRTDRKPLQDLIPLKQPLRVLIDPCDTCNFRCDFCFQNHVNGFHGGAMDDKTFNICLRQLQEFDEPINVVHLYGFGEPLLNKEVSKYVKKLKQAKCAKEVAITSNGSLLNEEISKELIDAGLDRLSVSLNGLNDEDFQKIANAKVNFSKFYKSIQYFYSISRGKCHLHIKINGDYFAEEAREKFCELFESCTDSMNIDNVVNVWPGISITDDDSAMYDICRIEGDVVCPQMFYELCVHSDGSVSPCCADYDYKRQNIGNIFESTLKNIWNGRQLKDMRIATLRKKDNPYDCCNQCDYPACASTVNITEYADEILEKIK